MLNSIPWGVKDFLTAFIVTVAIRKVFRDDNFMTFGAWWDAEGMPIFLMLALFIFPIIALAMGWIEY